MDICEAWAIDLVNVHCIRKATYKGVNARVNARLKLPFDGVTLPGAIFLVAWLQSRAASF